MKRGKEGSAKNLRVLIYIGRGASHSWIWLVDTLDKYGFRNIQFTDNVSDLKADILVISGGDPFAMYSHMGKRGVSRIKSFIKEGGTYIGVCAGCYFALTFHKNPYPWLNLVKGTISNFSESPPPNIAMPHKYLVPYREGAVFHPVREAIMLNFKGDPLRAPLYGGPGIVSAEAESLAKYTQFTEKTVFLCDRRTAGTVLLNTHALIHKNVGKGDVYLFGPHFEHPFFPQANEELVTTLSQVNPRGYTSEYTGELLSGSEKKEWVKNVKRWVSNGRLAAFGLENYHWKIGEKIYDPERLAYFFDTSFRLVTTLESQPQISATPLESEAKALALQVRNLGPDPQKAETLLENAKKFTSTLYTLYFSTLQQLLQGGTL